MNHKKKAKKYFMKEYLKNHHFLVKSDKKKVNKMFYHLFEAVKEEVREDLRQRMLSR